MSGERAIISHFNGNYYFGGWKADKRNGLGLDWHPERYVYYGQFKNNLKEGTGIYQGSKGDFMAGSWLNNHFGN